MVFGELLWDVFPKQEHLGGAAANVAYHAALLGASSHLISRVGADVRGRKAIELLRAVGVDASEVQIDPLRATGQVNVTLINAEPHFEIGEKAAWDAIFPPTSPGATSDADVFCFGTLAQRSEQSRRTLHAILNCLSQLNAASRPMRLLDLNVRPPYCDSQVILTSIRSADVLKLNDNELILLEKTFGWKNGVKTVLDRFNLRWVVVTHGHEGATLYGHSIRHTLPAPKVAGGDSVGAGDAFVAALAVAFGAGLSLLEAMPHAVNHAAWVAGQVGAMPKPSSGLRSCCSRSL